MLPDAERRARFIKRLFEAKGELFLDIGCTDGRLERRLKRYKDSFIGIDVDERALKIAKADGLKVIMADARYLPFKNERFNGVICSEVLEHIDNDTLAVSEMARVVKKGCISVVSVPNKDSDRFLPFKNLLVNYYARLENETLHVRKGYTASELKELFGRVSLRLQRVEYDLKIVGAFFHLVLWLLYSRQDTKYRRFILRAYKRLLYLLSVLYPLDNILQRQGLQLFATFIKT